MCSHLDVNVERVGPRHVSRPLNAKLRPWHTQLVPLSRKASQHGAGEASVLDLLCDDKGELEEITRQHRYHRDRGRASCVYVCMHA